MDDRSRPGPARGWRLPLAVAGTILALIALSVGGAARSPADAAPAVTVVARGLDNPRGLAFGPDGALYVAEAGRGGTATTAGQCPQVPAPVGPYRGGKTARISRIGPDGARTTVVDGLPSGINSTPSGDTVGVAAVAFVGPTLYALVAGGGCSHGVPDVPAGVIRANPDGTWAPIADLSAYQRAHPVPTPPVDDFEPDGTWYSLVATDGVLYAVEPNHGELVRIGLDGTVARVAELSSEPWAGPTGLAYRDGNFYTGTLTEFPLKRGAARLLRVTPQGRVDTVATGLTAVIGVAFDRQGTLYAAEFSTADNAPPTPGTGAVVRVSAAGAVETVADGLSFPTALAFGPDGQLYVSRCGACGPGQGEIVRLAAGTPAMPGLPNTGRGGGHAVDPGRSPLVAALLAGTALAAGAALVRHRGRRCVCLLNDLPG